jgi:hypothetical protein
MVIGLREKVIELFEDAAPKRGMTARLARMPLMRSRVQRRESVPREAMCNSEEVMSGSLIMKGCCRLGNCASVTPNFSQLNGLARAHPTNGRASRRKSRGADDNS